MSKLTAYGASFCHRGETRVDIALAAAVQFRFHDEQHEAVCLRDGRQNEFAFQFGAFEIVPRAQRCPMVLSKDFRVVRESDRDETDCDTDIIRKLGDRVDVAQICDDLRVERCEEAERSGLRLRPFVDDRYVDLRACALCLKLGVRIGRSAGDIRHLAVALFFKRRDHRRLESLLERTGISGDDKRR